MRRDLRKAIASSGTSFGKIPIPDLFCLSFPMEERTPAPDGMKPMSAALEAARRIAADGRTHSLVIDVERQGLVQFAMAKTLSEGLEAEYMHLEELEADTLVRTLKDIL